MKNKLPTLQQPFTRREFLKYSTLSGIGLAGLGLPGLSWADRGDQLHISYSSGDFRTFDPPFAISDTEFIVNYALHSYLLKPKAGTEWGVELDAVESFQKRDSLHFDFRLKPGLMFSHGFGEMTADDVKFSLERAASEEMQASNIADWGPFSHVDVHDRYSGTLVLNSPYAAFETVALAGTSAAIFPRAAADQMRKNFNFNPPCFSGPYQLQEWQPLRKAIIERNPEWTGPEAAYSEIHIYPMEHKIAELAFEAGELDITGLSETSVDSFRQNLPPSSALQVGTGTDNKWIGLNADNPELQDIRVRRAIQYAIDVDACLQAGWFGLPEPSTGPIPKGMVGHRAVSGLPLRGDIAKAKELLHDAGVSLPLKLRYDSANTAEWKTLGQVVQWCLKKVNIELELRFHDSASYYEIGMESKGEEWKDLQVMGQSFMGGADPIYFVMWFTSMEVGNWNWERFSNEEFDRLNDLAIQTTDVEERQRMYTRMADLMEQSGCFRFLTHGVNANLYRTTTQPVFGPDSYPVLRQFRPAGKSA